MKCVGGGWGFSEAGGKEKMVELKLSTENYAQENSPKCLILCSPHSVVYLPPFSCPLLTLH